MPQPAQREWILKRNCALSPRQLAFAYALPFVFSLLVALVFAWHGIWHVLLFTVVEALVLICAFIHLARHIADCEHIVLAEGSLVIERISAGHVSAIRLDAYRTRVIPPRKLRELIQLEARDIHIDVGSFVNDAKRRQIAQDLHTELASKKTWFQG